MKSILSLLVISLIIWSMNACNNASAPLSFCDTACLKDSIKFSDDAHPLQPSVFISARDCVADTISWAYTSMGVTRKMSFTDLLGTTVRLNKSAVSCFIKDTSYAWVLFNDCMNSRGYVLKIPFNKRENIERKSSGVNAHDPKFSVAEGLVTYSDRGNLFVEDMATGKAAMMTFGEKMDIDYDAIHEYIDSVNITPTRIWAKVKLQGGWKEVEKAIELK